MAVWVPNELLSDELVDDGLAHYERELEPHDRVMFRQGLALAREAAEKAAERRDPGCPGDLRWKAISRAHGVCELCGEKLQHRQRMELEHMVSRLSASALHIPWSILHSEPNLAGACPPCNDLKGTNSLTPDDIRWMWDYHHFGGPSEEGHVLLFFANLLEKHAWDVIPLRAQIATDMGRPLMPKKTIGAILREQGLDVGEVHHRRDRARYDVERDKHKVWEGERPSDDNREGYYRAPWQ